MKRKYEDTDETRDLSQSDSNRERFLWISEGVFVSNMYVRDLNFQVFDDIRHKLLRESVLRCIFGHNWHNKDSLLLVLTTLNMKL